MRQERISKGRYRATLDDGTIRYKIVADAGRQPNGERRQVRQTFRTLKEAKQALAQIRVDVDSGDYVARSKVTVKEYLDTWLAGREGIRETTRGSYRSDLKPTVDRFGHMKLQALQPAHLIGFKDELKAKGVSPRTITVTLTILSQALGAAKRQRLVTINAASSEFVERPGATPRVKRQTWTPEQVATYLAHVQPQRLYAAWLLTFLGLRRSEVLGLTWDAIDLDRGTVTVKQGRTINKGKGESTVVGAPRTSNGYRTIPTPPHVVDALKAFRRTRLEECLALGCSLGDDSLVVVDEAGVPVYPDRYSDLFWENTKAAGLPLIRLHDARHTAATLLHARYGLPLAVAAQYLGHSTAVYMSTYVHGESAFSQVADALGQMQSGR